MDNEYGTNATTINSKISKKKKQKKWENESKSGSA